MEYRISTHDGTIYTLEEYAQGPWFYIGENHEDRIKRAWEAMEVIEMPEDPKEQEKMRRTMKLIYDPVRSFVDQMKPYQIQYNVMMNNLNHLQDNEQSRI